MTELKEEKEISVILPAKNEAKHLELLLPEILHVFRCDDFEVIVVNDGSDDFTSEVCARFDVREIRHVYSVGNGGAIKTGARAARGKILAFMDADGQHAPADLKLLVEKVRSGLDMAVGARNFSGQASIGRGLANIFYNRLASSITGRRIEDLTSGVRAANAQKFREFLHLLPNGFSYPTTITMAFFKAGYSVRYVPVSVLKRSGKSHVNPLRDGLRFLAIIFKVGTLYSPLKIFVPFSIMLFSGGLGWYAYTYTVSQRFTNMSALLFTFSLLVFLLGLISEQITTLIYTTIQRNKGN